MELNVKNYDDWVLVDLGQRLDSFSHNEFKAELEKLIKGLPSGQVAFDLSDVQFLSMPSIQLITSIAAELDSRGGQMALVGTPEKLKRQIDIFASLDHLSLYRSHRDWEQEHLSGTA